MFRTREHRSTLQANRSQPKESQFVDRYGQSSGIGIDGRGKLFPNSSGFIPPQNT